MDDSNYWKFRTALCSEYYKLFESDPMYTGVRGKMTPERLAEKVTNACREGRAELSGKGIRAVCKSLAIPCKAQALKEYLREQLPPSVGGMEND